MSRVELTGVTKSYTAGTLAVDRVDLSIGSGEFVVLLGPSGCGKTTTLRMVAGLELPSGGKITIDGEDVTRKGPAERDVGFVFQFYALYPHFTCAENIAFPLECAGVERRERGERVARVALRLGILDLLPRRPRELSGGDQQRVALARAMVRKPAVYLMDEPLGTLDAERRAELCEFIREQQLSTGVTTLYVTHDQEEAMRLADRVVVMSAGKILQAAPPLEVYDQPANRFVAHFVGSPGMNFVEGELAGGRFRSGHYGEGFACAPGSLPSGGGGRLVLGIRPEFVKLGPASDSGHVRGRIVADEDLGSSRALHVDTPCGRLVARVAAESPGRRGDEVSLTLEARGIRWFAPGDGASLP